MLYKIGRCLIDISEILHVSKCSDKEERPFPYVRGFSSLKIGFKNGHTIDLAADNDKQMDQFFDEIWNACSVTYTGVTWSYKTPEVGDNQNG